MSLAGQPFVPRFKVSRTPTICELKATVDSPAISSGIPSLMSKTDSSSSIPRQLSRNVVVAGETGVGKSSFINLVVGSDVATTANDVLGVTVKKSYYYWETPLHSFRLWDTPGLGEGSFGNVSPKDAEHALRSLLRELERDGGVHLLVLCMRGIARVTRGMKLIYDIILRIRDHVSPKLRIVAVITELEKRCDPSDIVSSMDEWWSSNLALLIDFKMVFDGHACLTTLPDDGHPPLPGRRHQCQTLARNLVIDYSLPFVCSGAYTRVTHNLSNPSLKLTRNIVVVGETGVGKSSVINLIVGKNSSVVASDARAVTVGTSFHDWNLMQQTFRLWDTPGLGERPLGSVSPRHAYNALRSLLTELGRGGGVHLIILCMRGGRRVTKSMKQTYQTIASLRDKISFGIPIIAVITELETRSTSSDILSSMDQWWTTNSDALSDMLFAGHACITTLPDDCHPEIPGRRDECQRLVRDLLVDHSLPPRATPQKDLHVILFGETGVGKSSIVNLLSGWPVASSSPDSVACTLESTEYQFQLGSTTVRLWDTVGLGEPDKGTIGYMAAIEKATELIRRLNASGGISLFVYCIRGNRVTTTMQSNYRLFYEILGKKQVPIVLAVTHLEREQVMDEWWTRNASTLEKRGISVSGHACITTLEGHSKYAESRNILQELLWQYADQGKFFMSLESWIGRLLKGLSLFLGIGFPRGGDLTRILMRRCHLELDVAQRVADCIESGSDV